MLKSVCVLKYSTIRHPVAYFRLPFHALRDTMYGHPAQLTIKIAI